MKPKLFDDSKPCVVCKNPGTRRPIEILPNGGILFIVQHDDGTTCNWATYTSLEQMQKPDSKRDPTEILCPRCEKPGRVNWAKDDGAPKDEQAFRVKYIVVHGEIPGTWGRRVKIKKRERCQSFNQEERDKILKALNRYIQTPPPKLSFSQQKPDPILTEEIEKVMTR